ncbi:MAG TPA: hypothetical protein VFF30_02635 [Nitrososphaerales archaeon]|nr:hypothetical protein [Nitrososphaerales archaeon]
MCCFSCTTIRASWNKGSEIDQWDKRISDGKKGMVVKISKDDLAAMYQIKLENGTIPRIHFCEGDFARVSWNRIPASW